MDPISNLSLLEIAAEDDSLLLEVPRGRDDSTVTTATNSFLCSPLQCLRSLPPRPPQTEVRIRVGAVDSENLSSSPKDGVNKENMSGSKSEAPKLSVEPQQMKRKKKGVGYNLRKSLAWDRAFFTEEGVLNTLELSMISGTNTELQVIHEEEPDTLLGGTSPVTASSELQKIEENLFKHSSDGISIKGRKIGACLSPNPGALNKDIRAPSSLVKRKVLAVNDVNRNRSKRNACPRLAASSSPDTAKTPSKQSKVTKTPGPKSKVSVITTTARSGISSTGYSKRNHNAHPATNVQNYAEVKGPSKNPRTIPSVSKVDSAGKRSVSRYLTKQTGKHLDNSVSVIHPPSRLQQPGTEANKVLEACLPQGVSDTSEKKQQTQFQITKPSGLRMPSPSLGFFSQAKASCLHSQLQKISKPCKPAQINIPRLRKFEANSVNEARLLHAPMESSEIVKGAAKNCSNLLSLSDVKSEPSMLVDNNHIAGVEVEGDSLGFEKISKQEMVENILEQVNVKSKEQAELHKSENVSNKEDMDIHGHDKKLLSKSRTHEQLEKADEHPLEDKLYVLSNGDMSVVKEPQSMHQQSMHRTLTGRDNLSNTMHGTMGQDEDEQIKLLICDVPTSNESLVLQEEHEASYKDSRHFGEFKEYNCVETGLVNSSLGDYGETVLGGSLQGISYKNTEQVNDGAGDFGKQAGVAQVDKLKGNLSVDRGGTSQSILEAVNQQSQYFHKMDENCGEQLGTPNPSIVGEIGLKSENESLVNSCQLIHVATLSSKNSSEKSIPEIGGVCEMEDCQHLGDGQSDFIQSRPVDGVYDQQPIESKAMHDRNQAFELEGMCEDCITVSTIACMTKLNSVSPERGPFYETNTEDLHFTSQLCPNVRADCASTENDLLIRHDSSPRNTSMNCDVQHDVPRNSEQKASLLKSSETNKMLCESESLVANHGQLLDEGRFSEVAADINSNTEDLIGSGAPNPSTLLQHESHVEDAQAQSFDDNLVACNCNNEHCLSIANDQFPLASDNLYEQSHLSELQRPSLVGVDSQHVNKKLHLDDDWLPKNTACSEEIKKKNLFEGALERCKISEYSADHHLQAMPEIKDENLEVDERAEHLQVGRAKGSSTDMSPLVEVQINHKFIAAEFDSSIKVNEDCITEAVDWKPDDHCSPSEDSKLPAADNLTCHSRIPQGSEVSSFNSKKFSEEAEAIIFERDELPNTDMRHQTKSGISYAEDSSKIIHLEKIATKSRQDAPTMKPPPNAAAFSDEWLAAIEAAGEEILTMKSGAVQNSPPEKPQHEPGPWSPVRRKNQSIGPFDCTKHTIPHSSS